MIKLLHTHKRQSHWWSIFGDHRRGTTPRMCLQVTHAVLIKASPCLTWMCARHKVWNHLQGPPGDFTVRTMFSLGFRLFNVYQTICNHRLVLSFRLFPPVHIIWRDKNIFFLEKLGLSGLSALNHLVFFVTVFYCNLVWAEQRSTSKIGLAECSWYILE